MPTYIRQSLLPAGPRMTPPPDMLIQNKGDSSPKVPSQPKEGEEIDKQFFDPHILKKKNLLLVVLLVNNWDIYRKPGCHHCLVRSSMGWRRGRDGAAGWTNNKQPTPQRHHVTEVTQNIAAKYSFMSIFNLVQKRKKKTNVLLPNITLSKTKTERINFYRTNAINRICLNVVNEYN